MPENPEVTDKASFDWQIVREARRQIGFATNGSTARAANLLSALLLSAPDADVDQGELAAREGGMMEKVIYFALKAAAEGFVNPDPADPGLSSEMYEDMLRDAAIEYAQAILARRSYGN